MLFVGLVYKVFCLTELHNHEGRKGEQKFLNSCLGDKCVESPTAKAHGAKVFSASQFSGIEKIIKGSLSVPDLIDLLNKIHYI